MKTFLLLLSLSAVAVGQQAKPAEKCVEGATRKQVVCPKPPKRKPSRTITCPADSGGDCEVFDGAIVRIRPRAGWDTGDPNLATLTVFDPCDGISCVGPVEMMPGKKCDDCAAAVPHSYSDWPPDKAAVPVDLFVFNVADWKPKPCPEGKVCSAFHLTMEGGNPDAGGGNPFEVDIRCDEDFQGKDCFKPDAVIVSTPSSSVIKLSDSEYSHLQQLRAAVVEEEKRLAVKYGASVPPQCSSLFEIFPGTVCEFMPQGPHFEFHGQFLLIDKGGK